MPNPACVYSPAQVNAIAPPTVSRGGSPRTYEWENRLQDGGRLEDPVAWGQVLNDKWIWSITLPVGDPVPLVTEIIPPFRTSARDRPTVEAEWPMYPPRAAILPFGDLWRPIPWRMVNAVNLVRGHLGIREEGFLEDVGGPKPNPRPQEVHKPAPRYRDWETDRKSVV